MTKPNKPISDDAINLAFENVSLEDKYEAALKMLEEMAGALESNNLWIKDLPSCDAAYVNNKYALDNYRKWKEGIK